eukprot:2532801-Rhodomonas_salina.1
MDDEVLDLRALLAGAAEHELQGFSVPLWQFQDRLTAVDDAQLLLGVPTLGLLPQVEDWWQCLDPAEWSPEQLEKVLTATADVGSPSGIMHSKMDSGVNALESADSIKHEKELHTGVRKAARVVDIEASNLAESRPVGQATWLCGGELPGPCNCDRSVALQTVMNGYEEQETEED